MGKTCGYMVTWTTYGTWLQGDERGFVKKGQVLGANKGLKEANIRKLKGETVKLKKAEREVASEEKGKFIVYSKQPDEVIVRIPQSHIIVKKAIQEYEQYLKQIKDKLFISFMEKCGEHSLANNLTRKIFEDFDLPLATS